MYQRSCDTMLGVPFNIASMSLLLKIFARACNMQEGIATWIGGDTHLYVNHVGLAQMQTSRKPYALPQLFIKKELHNLDDILALEIEDFELVGYKAHPKIDAELFTGLKK
jgi:thymidylate synthase